ncbi:helix-turn-helix domain-containing protein [uncultured Arsenicicoccus sp.]|uniref:helix-turn-helix domain-containing protein n=1 Tax=uncultured Arsenicicoccus sp. TaxID=491339 RepID=UPI0025990792|nr:helix-turn-helix domain-containing protein [uncultured Arsenicicoccus sp.]
MTTVYTIAETCELLQVSPSTVKRLLNDGPSRGGLTRIKVRSAVRIPASEVEALLAGPKRRRRP